MSQSYSRLGDVSGVRFSKASFHNVPDSTVTTVHTHITTFDAGRLIPIGCFEVLPRSQFSMNLDDVIRQITLLTPTMGQLEATVTAFFVPNRIVNDSWRAVQGENFSGSWVAPEVSLAPLYDGNSLDVKIPVGSLADYYGFPTQEPLPATLLKECHDLKFRGYTMIWNEFFRDQNYQPPIPISYLNVYEGFFENGAIFKLGGTSNAELVEDTTLPDGTYPNGAIAHAIYGSTTPTLSATIPSPHSGQLNALAKPLRVNKFHDYFTSVLPNPQKGPTVYSPVSGQIGSSIPVVTSPLSEAPVTNTPLMFREVTTGAIPLDRTLVTEQGHIATGPLSQGEGRALYPYNLVTAVNAPVTGLSMSIDDLRMSAAIQQYYEILARGGSRYREIVQTMFGLEVDNPFSDVPVCLCRETFSLDTYQTAQTSASETGSTPQGNLAAFGYTAKGGHLFDSTFVEHGYIHVFVVVRHRNLYSSYFGKDNLRRNGLDFYTPPFANISNQPVYTYEINPFSSDTSQIFGYQEAWAEYRFDPDRVSGFMRPGIRDGDNNNVSLAVWNYADDFDPNLKIADRDWLLSNTEEVVNRTVAQTSNVAPQFKGQFRFTITKTLPMPTESVPGMDII